ncbi:hypothetical protein AB0I51_04265 [Streptomyces sp. NPDC050549]|uniref:hypothetical protein n=1 Tax=Streptomyces sp. NPDC050549 TaxID=3155406 RepID=UPI00343774C6
MGFLNDPDTAAICATLLVAVGLPALVYAGIARLTGRGRKGGPPWQPTDDPVNALCAVAAVAGYALASAAVTGSWGPTFGFLPTAFIGGCFSSAFAYTFGGGTGRQLLVQPALLLLMPYALALGFFGRVAA